MLLENYLSGHDVAKISENDGGYNYYCFCRPRGTWRILREKLDGTEYKLAIGNKDFELNFDNRATLNYRFSSELPTL